MSRGQSKSEIQLGIGIAILAAIGLVIISGLAFAGLLVLYYAKLKEEALLDESKDAFYPLWISIAATAAIYVGSASGALLAGLAGNFDSVCHVTHGAFPKAKCPLVYWSGERTVDIPLYLRALLTNHALGFWVELCVGLYVIRFGVVKRLREGITYRRAVKTIGMQLRAANSGIMALVFLLGNPIVGYFKHPRLGCDPDGPICKWASEIGWWDIPGFLIAKLTSWVDPWLILPYTLVSSVGNQFKLAGLFPVIGGAYWLYLTLQSGRTFKDMLPNWQGKSIGPPAGMITIFPRQLMPNPRALETVALVVGSLLVGALSFYSMLKVLD